MDIQKEIEELEALAEESIKRINDAIEGADAMIKCLETVNSKTFLEMLEDFYQM